ncbi:stalk domain-containing protein [Anaerotignum propionicum]|uniref:stalk domain-containing protein n=1 Tax=Anaerotignum propionicum TaxID=28446 RepID=UPI002108FE86|nr:stalk domain-containing protein [Anaerotignum propionicum]MCQ4935536.1 copper amine oxidase N-terminal domain-containing protein [Anaerotignum propionicum]
MKNNEKVKYIAMGMTISATIMGAVVPAIAKSTQENITALYKNIKVVNEGILVETGDAEPFIANGTTYLPVRAVGEAVGKKVSWDGKTNTVYLGQVPGEEKYLTDLCPPYDGSFYKVYKSSDNKYFEMSGEKRTNGFELNGWYFGSTHEAYVLINTNGKYEQLSFDVGHLDGTYKNNPTLEVYVDGRLVKEEALKGDEGTRTISVPLNYGLNVKMYIKGGYYGFADVKVW